VQKPASTAWKQNAKQYCHSNGPSRSQCDYIFSDRVARFFSIFQNVENICTTLPLNYQMTTKYTYPKRP
jgi:hypothetical protein